MFVTPSANLTWILILVFLTFLVIQDPNVGEWLVLTTKTVLIWVERQWYRLRYHPDSPWVRYEIKRNSDKLAREIMKEIKNR